MTYQWKWDFDSKRRDLLHVCYVAQLPPMLLLLVYYWYRLTQVSNYRRKYKLQGEIVKIKYLIL